MKRILVTYLIITLVLITSCTKQEPNSNEISDHNAKTEITATDVGDSDLNTQSETSDKNTTTETSNKNEAIEKIKNTFIEYADDKKVVIPNDWATYTDEKFHFSVKYPNTLDTKIEEFREATSEYEASPDTGINIYLNKQKDEYINVYGQSSHLQPINNDDPTKFVTNSQIEGELYFDEYEGKNNIALILGDRTFGAFIRVKATTFEAYKDEIIGIMKSITKE